jgi:hypothetical protein
LFLFFLSCLFLFQNEATESPQHLNHESGNTNRAACCLVLKLMKPSQIDWRGYFIDKHKSKQRNDERNMHQNQATTTVHAHMQDPRYVAVVPSASSQDQ